MICTEIDTKLHENHKIIPLHEINSDESIKREIDNLDSAISKLKQALKDKLCPQIDRFSTTHAKLQEQSMHQVDDSKALLESNNGEIVKNAVCPGYLDFFTGYLIFIRSSNNNNNSSDCGNEEEEEEGAAAELPTLLMSKEKKGGNCTFVQLPVGLVVRNCEVVGENKVSVEFHVENNKFVQSLSVNRSFEYKTADDDSWKVFDEEKGIICDFVFEKDYLFRVKFTLKSNLSSFAYSKTTPPFKYNQPNNFKPTPSKTITTSSQQQSQSSSITSPQNNTIKKEETKKISERNVSVNNSPEYADISFMSNTIKYYTGVFRSGRNYILRNNSTIITITSPRGWENTAIGTTPLIPGARNRWFFRFRKSALSWVAVGVTTNSAQGQSSRDGDDSDGDGPTFWGLSFHNKRLVEGAPNNFSYVTDFDIPKGLDTRRSVFGVEFDMRTENACKLYLSFWDDLCTYRLAFGKIDVEGKNVYPVITPYNRDDEFELIGQALSVSEDRIKYDDSTGIVPKTKKIVLSRDLLSSIIKMDSDDADPEVKEEIMKYLMPMSKFLGGSDDDEEDDDEDDDDDEEEDYDDEEEDDNDKDSDEDDDYDDIICDDISRFGDDGYYSD